MEIWKVENLCKTYGKGEAKVDALKNVSFCLEKGEFTAVVGESGSVFIAGQNLLSMKEEKRTILMITHNSNIAASVGRVLRVSDGILTDLGGTKNEALS